MSEAQVNEALDSTIEGPEEMRRTAHLLHTLYVGCLEFVPRRQYKRVTTHDNMYELKEPAEKISFEFN